MAELKFTKQELRSQQVRLTQLERYLPTLRLRKAILQAEVVTARNQLETISKEHTQQFAHLRQSAKLLGLQPHIPITDAWRVAHLEEEKENIAGVELPILKAVAFAPLTYDLYDTPAWLDGFVQEVRTLKTIEIKKKVAEKRMSTLSQELRQVSIRVNLFEKVLIPKCIRNIKAIRIFLGDLQLAAVAQAKIAKAKILARQAV